MRSLLAAHIELGNEKVLTYLVAQIVDRAADQAPYLALLCGEHVPCTGATDLWFEQQPLSPRAGKRGVDSEGNTKIDLAFGAIRKRVGKKGGIEYDRATPHTFVCFIEGKGPKRDCDFQTEHHPFRNQLERDIESLLCFQAHGHFPTHLYFTLLTPRLFKENPRTRLYGYRMTEYLANREQIVTDLAQYKDIPRRDDGEYEYPLIAERLMALKLNWVTYEDILELAFGLTPFDIVKREHTAELVARLRALADQFD
jgi:hypothetical protein